MSQYMLLGGRHLYMYVPFCPHAPFSCSATWQESRSLSSITSSDGSTTSVYSVYCLPHTTTSHCLHQPHSSRDDHTPWTSHGSTHRYVTCNWVANEPSSLVPRHTSDVHLLEMLTTWEFKFLHVLLRFRKLYKHQVGMLVWVFGSAESSTVYGRFGN